MRLGDNFLDRFFLQRTTRRKRKPAIIFTFGGLLTRGIGLFLGGSGEKVWKWVLASNGEGA